MAKKLIKSPDFDPLFNRLIDICDRKGISVSNLLDMFATSRSAISAWKKGNISANIVADIVDYLGVTADYLLKGEEAGVKEIKLFDNEQELFDIYSQLSAISKGCVLERARVLLELETEKKFEAKSKTITILSSEYRVSAGQGIMLDDDSSMNRITVPDTPEARKADFALTICGDSMDPIYHDGDVVLVRKMPSLEVGEIGIFYVDGSGYIKKYGGDRLISLNSAYDDIPLDENTRCFGKVIGRA